MSRNNIILFSFLTLLFISGCKDAPPLVLDEGKILNDVHKNNIGRLVFMSDWISIEDFAPEHFGKELSISESSDFAFRMFLEKTLTHYLSQLEPNLPVRELCEKGNFQLTFYVDNKEIYKFNLQPGAGSCEYKNSATLYGIPLIDHEERDHWGRFLWMKFLKKEGGQKALSNGSPLLKIEVRPYINNEKLKVGEIIAKGEVILNYEEEKEIAESQISIQPILPTNKWEISDFKYDTTLVRDLNKKIAQKYFKELTSVVVIKDGKLLIEEYFNGSDRNAFHDTRSVGKTLASTIMGLAIKDGYIKNENQTLKDFYSLKSYENYSKAKENISLKSLLTMSSSIEGTDFDADSPGNEENMYPTSDWVKFGLDLPIDQDKKMGENWDYLTAGAVILGDILDRSLPNGMVKYANQKLFKPLGITEYKWQFTPTDVPNTAGGFQMNSLDNARYGQLYIDNGMHNGTEIIPSQWVKSSLSKQVAIPMMENEHYGYLFWNKKYPINGKEYDSYYASGNGGNKIIVLKEIGVLIVITAQAYGKAYMHLQADEIVRHYILPSIIE